MTEIEKQFNLIAEEYDANRRYFIPCFDDFYRRSISILKFVGRDICQVADLGAGTGLSAMELYRLFPSANFKLFDIAEDMLNIAKKRFAGLNNFEYFICDYANGFEAAIGGEKFDLIASALSIHHLENGAKASLYRTAFNALKKGGIFLNLDQFNAGDRAINEAYNKLWLNYIDQSGITDDQKSKWIERKKLDRETTIEQEISALKLCGFSEAENIYRFMKFGVNLAIK